MARKEIRHKSRRKSSTSAGSGSGKVTTTASTNIKSHTAKTTTTTSSTVGTQNNNNNNTKNGTSDETDGNNSEEAHSSTARRRAGPRSSPRHEHNNSTPPPPSVPIWHYIDIEPFLTLHLIAAMITYIGNSRVMVEKACRVDLRLGEEACTALASHAPTKGSYRMEEEQVQKLLSSLYMWRTIIENFLPIILVCQIGAWSDKHGRKLPMLMVILTFILNYVFLAVSSHYRTATGAWSMGLVSSGIQSLAGNNACFGMAAFSYVADITPKEKLTSRTSVTGSCYFVGILAGLMIGGYIGEMSPTTVFAISAAIEVFTFFGLLVVVKRTRSKGSAWTQVKDLFSSQYIKESVQSVSKWRPEHGREMLLLLLGCHVVTLAPLVGESSVDFLAARYRYEWDAPDYSEFIIYKTILGFLSNFLCMGLLHEFLQLSDPVVGIISCLSLMASALISAFANSTKWYCVGPIAAMLSGSVMAVPRSMMFKFIPETETGKINSFLGSVESLTPLIISPVYTFVYLHTFQVFAGAYYVLSAVLITFPIWAYIWILTNNNKTD